MNAQKLNKKFNSNLKNSLTLKILKTNLKK